MYKKFLTLSLSVLLSILCVQNEQFVFANNTSSKTIQNTKTSLKNSSKNKIKVGKKVDNSIVFPKQVDDFIDKIVRECGGQKEYVILYFNNIKKNSRSTEDLVGKTNDFMNRYCYSYDLLKRYIDFDLSKDIENLLTFILLSNDNYLVSQNIDSLDSDFIDKLSLLLDKDKRFKEELSKQKEDYISSKPKTKIESNQNSQANSAWDNFIIKSLKEMGLKLNDKLVNSNLNVRDGIIANINASRIVNNLSPLIIDNNLPSDNSIPKTGKSENDVSALRTNDLDRYINMDKLILIEKNKSQNGDESSVNSISFYDSKGNVVSEINKNNQGIVSFYKYDDLGRMIEEIQADAKSTWNENTWVFDRPIAWNEKIKGSDNFIILKKINYSYVGDGENLIERGESSPLLSIDPDKPAKLIKYYYLYGDLSDFQNSEKYQNSSSEDSINETLFETQIRNLSYYWHIDDSESDDLKNKLTRIELQTLNLSTQKYSIIHKVKFYYSKGLSIKFIQENDEDKYIVYKDDISFPESKKRLLNDIGFNYNINSLKIKGVIDFPEYIAPINYIDADGSMIYEKYEDE